MDVDVFMRTIVMISDELEGYSEFALIDAYT